MHQDMPAIERARAKVRISNIAPKQPDRIAQVRGKFGMVAMNLRNETIKNRDLMATAQELASDTRSDETGATRDKHSILQIEPLIRLGGRLNPPPQFMGIYFSHFRWGAGHDREVRHIARYNRICPNYSLPANPHVRQDYCAVTDECPIPDLYKGIIICD
jgi:hypothetical protein